MQSKTLESIQTISKVGKVLSNIAFVFCLVGAILCAVGIATVGVPDNLKVGGVTIHPLIGGLEGIGTGAAYAAMASGIILCAAAAVLSKLYVRYFDNELAAGTPFTFEGASELLRLGICTICIPLGAIIVAGICQAVIGSDISRVAEVSIDGSTSIGLGIAIIVMSLVCKHGAEISGNAGTDAAS